MEALAESVSGLKADIVEAQTFVAQATRAPVKAALTKLVTRLETELEKTEAALADAFAKEAAASSLKDQVAELEKKKDQAIADEDYEACAKFRDEIATLNVKMAEAPAKKASSTAKAPTLPSGAKWQPIGKFSWEQGEYNTPWVNIYASLPGVGTVKDSVTCTFTKGSFDLQVAGLGGLNYRLLKDNLDKNIVPDKSKFTVKADRVTIKLKKIKGEYNYDNWNDLEAKRRKTGDEKSDPSAGIMDMMKDMYDDGDDNMKKAIGEAMMKSRSGDKSKPSMPGMGGGMGGGF